MPDRRSDPRSPASRRAEIERLRAEITEVNRTWGRRARFPEEAGRLEDALVTRRMAAAALDFQIEAARRSLGELESRRAALLNEVGGLEQGLEALLRKVLEETTAACTPMWSPVPVYGYRLWWVTREGLAGATGFVWKGLHLSAVCGRTGLADGDVPHTDGRCGAPPCGIYALKECETILRYGIPRRSERAGHFLGLVALSGKVVEHDRGYRAQHAGVVAGVLLGPGGLVLSDDRAWLEAVFRSPAGVLAGAEGPRPGAAAYAEVIEYFERCVIREEQTWTSGNRSA